MEKIIGISCQNVQLCVKQKIQNIGSLKLRLLRRVTYVSTMKRDDIFKLLFRGFGTR